MVKGSKMFKCMAVVLVGMFLVVACQSCQSTSQLVPKTPKEVSLTFIQTYNTQYADTMNMAKNGTPAQKEMAARKKEVLKKAWPLIKTYDAIVAGGWTPSSEQTQEINNLLNSLATEFTK